MRVKIASQQKWVLLGIFKLAEPLSPRDVCCLVLSHSTRICLVSVSLSVPLSSIIQHPSYGDCLEVKRGYYQNSSVLDCVTQCSQSAAHLCEQFLQVKQIGFVTLGPLHCA